MSETSEALNQARQQLQAGQPAEAEATCRAILGAAPDVAAECLLGQASKEPFWWPAPQCSCSLASDTALARPLITS